MALTIDELASKYHEAWGGLAVDAIVALHTDDSVFHIHGLTEAAIGRGPIRGLIHALLRVVPDLRFEPTRVYLGADHIVFEYDMAGTADGTAFVCEGADVIAVRDGLVARKDTYLDLGAYERQVGALPLLATGV